MILVPRDAAERVSVTEEALVPRRCGYWLSLRDLPDTSNSQTCRVHITCVTKVFQSIQNIDRHGTGTVDLLDYVSEFQVDG